MKRFPIWVLPLCLLAVVAALAVLLADPAGAPANVGMPCGTASLRDNSRPLQADKRACSAPPAETTNVESAKPEGKNPAVEADASATATESTALECTEPLHVPVYGPAVQRGGATAVFRLLDAHDQPLLDPSIGLCLWRRIGSRWLRDEAAWVQDAGEVRCLGAVGAGLEPGEYELLIDAGVYGSLSHVFRVNKEEALTSTVRTPHWRRIVCFEFCDLQGRPVDYIYDSPSVATPEPTVEWPEREGAPARVLRDPPSPPGGGRGGKGGFRYRRARGSGSRDAYFKTATDEGRYYVPVIAGTHNEVTFTFVEPWGTDVLKFDGLFEGADWDAHQVKLDLAPDFEQRTAEWEKLGTADPGARSHLGWIEQLQNPPAVDDVASVRSRRLVLELEGPQGVTPLYQVSSNAEQELTPDLAMKFRGGLYYVDTWPGYTVRFAIRLGTGEMTPLEKYTFATDAEERLHKIKRTVEAQMVESPVWRFTPTVEAWAVRRELHLMPQGDQDGALPKWLVNLREPRYPLYQHTLDKLTSADACNLYWRIGGAAVREVKAGNASAMVALDMLKTGAIEQPRVRGLALRVIGPEFEGLPWVEASLVDYADDARARRLQEIEARLAADGKRPSLHAAHGDPAYDDAASEIEEDKWKGYLGEALFSELDASERVYYATQGAWYNTHRKLKSDHAGYMLEDFELVPGREYVLYLWSKSRNDLRPDTRIVFKAGEELTDLGAISLPTYTD